MKGILTRLAAASLLISGPAVAGGTYTADDAAPSRDAANTAIRVDQKVRVGEPVTVERAFTTQGSTTKQTVRHPGATYVKVHFASLDLATGDYVTVSDPQGVETYTYHGMPGDGMRAADSGYTVHGDGGFAAMSVTGDTAVVTLHRAAAGNTSKVSIDRYWRGYDQREYLAANPQLKSVCGDDARRNAVCYQNTHPVKYKRSHAVTRVLMDGGSACTSWRVGDTNRLLTNYHCMSTADEVAASETQFDYQCETCRGTEPKVPVKVSGAEMVKTSGSLQLDYTLYSVNDFDTITQFGTLYIDAREPQLGERIYIPGHGDAAPKRISVHKEPIRGEDELCTIENAQSSNWDTGYLCDTSGGNSGSPVLARSSHRVIALHHYGGNCTVDSPNEGVRMTLIYPEIADLIDNDPGN